LVAATGCWGSSVVAPLVDAVTAVAIALSGAGCGESDGDAETCRLSGALLTAGEAGETIVESVSAGEGSMRKSINRAFAYLMGQKVKMGVGQQIDTTDFHVEAIDLLSNHVPSEAGIELVVAVYSAIKRQSVRLVSSSSAI
jgi:hypothetical protein